MRRLFLVVGLLSICRAKIIPLASTVTASGLAASDRSSNTTSIGNGKGVAKSKGNERKSSLSIPKLWGRQQTKKESESKAGGDKAGVGSDIDTAGGESATKLAEDGIEDEGVASSSDIDGNAETTETDDKSQSESTENDEVKEVERRQAEPQPTNQTQTRPDIVYMNIAPPTGPMVIPRPMYPYMPMPQQPPPNNKSSSLLSSILSALLPRPQNMPPVSPYGPPQPSSPYAPGGNNAIVSLILRLALISLGTLLLDVLGLGSHSDAFIPTPAQHYMFERVNDRYRRDRSALSQALESPPPGIGKHRWRRVFWRRRREVLSSLALAEELSVSVDESPTLANGALYNRTVIIVDMKPDSRVGNGMAEHLKDTVSFIIEQHRDYVDKRSYAEKAYSFNHKLPLPSFFLPRSSSTTSPSHNHRTPNGMRPALGSELEVVLFLDSPGGAVQDYGLASSQLARLRNEPQITLSVCVDRVAASGGYMMACQATPGHLFAAPFAMVGSIGVLMETVNVNEVLKKYGVKALVIKAGKNKAPLKTLGEVTSEELQMAQDDADVIHEAFQQWVMESRPNVAVSQDWIEKVCTGAVFLGKEARELGLVDRVLTSDEYVAERIAAGDRVLRLLPYRGPQFGGLKISPLDLLLSSMDAEGRLKIREKARVLGMRVIRCAAPLFRVGAAVGVLNHLASLQSPYQGYTWAA
jgi:signal peptide peptidase SppA